MAVPNNDIFSFDEICDEIYGNHSPGKSSLQMFIDATGVFDPNYVTNQWGTKNNLLNFRNYQHTQPNGGYGRLYNGYAKADSRNIAPLGWHVPTPEEIQTLCDTIGPYTYTSLDQWGYPLEDRYHDYNNNAVGGLLKKGGTTHWLSPNTSATDLYEFSAVGGGYRYNGTFYSIKEVFALWTTQLYREMRYDTSGFLLNDGLDINDGASLRLIKDDSNNTGIMTDNSGYTYKTIKIGNQVWMAGNLRGTKYRTGEDIPVVMDTTAWNALTTGACCSYNNDDAWAYADNYVLPGTTIRIEINNGFDGTNYYLYAQAIDVSTGAPRGTNIDVTINFSYTYFSLQLGEDVTVNGSYIIYALANQSSHHVIPGPFIEYTPTSVTPTTNGSYTYIV